MQVVVLNVKENLGCVSAVGSFAAVLVKMQNSVQVAEL